MANQTGRRRGPSWGTSSEELRQDQAAQPEDIAAIRPEDTAKLEISGMWLRRWQAMQTEFEFGEEQEGQRQ